MSEALYPLAMIAFCAVVTWALRAFPFLLFSGRPLPKVIRYLGRALPPAIMTVLVVYCLRDVSFSQSPYGLPELAAAALVVVLQAVRKNMYLSIISGTVWDGALVGNLVFSSRRPSSSNTPSTILVPPASRAPIRIVRFPPC